MFSEIFVIAILLVCSGFFSASETAIFSLSKVQVHFLQSADEKSAQRLFWALRRPRELLITILLGNEFVNVSISIVGASLIAKTIEAGVRTELLLSILVVTPLVLVFGEVLPKNLALKYARQFAQLAVWPLGVFYKLVAPIRVVLASIADAAVALCGGSSMRDDSVMEDEYRKLVDLGSREGIIDEEEKEVIHNIFEFTDKVVLDIMTPFGSVFMLPIDLPFEKMVDEMKCTEYSRVPFYYNDRTNVVGVLHVRDLSKYYRKKRAGENVKIESVIRPPVFVTPNLPLERLLREFQRSHVHIAFVKNDEELIGIVTMDDVLEELFGEIEE